MPYLICTVSVISQGKKLSHRLIGPKPKKLILKGGWNHFLLVKKKNTFAVASSGDLIINPKKNNKKKKVVMIYLITFHIIEPRNAEKVC